MSQKNKKPSVLFINRVYPPYKGATGRLLRDLARHFAKSGWAISLLSISEDGGKRFEGAMTHYQVQGHVHSRSFLSYLYVWLKLLFKALFLPKHNLVITMTDPPLLPVVGGLVKLVRGSKHIHWSQDVYPDLLPVTGIRHLNFLMRFLGALRGQAIKNCDKLIVIGRCMADFFIDQNIPAQQITVLPNWPDFELCTEEGDLSKPTSDSSQRDKLRAEQLARHADEQVKQDPKFRVLYAGSIGLVHPVESIVEAASLLKDDYPEIEFVFVGGGDFFDWIAEQRTDKNLNNIRLIPFQPQNRLKALMESGDLHLVSMKEEAKGLLVPSKLYAALAAGRPCIFMGPEGSEVDRVLSEFEAGLRIATDDPKTLSELIIKYRQDSDFWFEAHKGALKAKDIFQPEEAMQAWVKRANQVVEYK